MRKRQWMDRQLNISGKLLLMDILKRFGLDDRLSLNDVQYNAYERPYFSGSGFDFNIAHSGNIVVCCGVFENKVGVDIEQVKQVDLTGYDDHFTPNEWERINSNIDPYNAFYDCWTRKEAVLKATGTGLHTPLAAIDVSNDIVIYDEITYYLQMLNIDPGYKCCVAVTIPKNIDLYQLIF